LRAIDAYEKASAVLQQVFDALLWGLRKKSGRALLDEILKLPSVSRAVQRAVANARTVSRDLEKAVADFKSVSVMNAPARAQAIDLIRDDVVLCGASVESAVSAVMNRHQAVQRDKRKTTWIDYGPVWMLMPGHGDDADRPPEYRNMFLHPIRITNGFEFLRELRLARLPSPVAADEN
jgi:hypothetical protein